MRARILVIDDERDILDALSNILEWAGFDAICVEHPRAIDEALADRRPDLFLVDVMLPGISGIKVAEDLRARSYRDTPMVAMSASEIMRRNAASSGVFQEALAKPFDIEQLLGCVNRYVA